MSGVFLLDWAVLAVSLFDTILLFWLGLTVVLNAERRTWGLWLAGGGLLVGGVFFLVHTAILGYGLNIFSPEVNLLWRFGWFPVVVLPFSWYLINLWYAGFFDRPYGQLRKRHLPWFVLVCALVVGVFLLLIFANPLPNLSRALTLELVPTPTVGGLPVLVVAYPLYMLLCMFLALDTLRRPGPSRRAMGEIARRRARPWLIITSMVLLATSLLVAWVMIWLITSVGGREYTAIVLPTVAWFDLAIAGLIGVGVLLLGRAVVAYEIFTGKSLPRQGLRRQWTRAAVLAGGYGLVVGGSLAYPLHPIFSLLLGTLLMTGFFALLVWRSYGERERYIHDLRPFVLSQQLFEQIVVGDPNDTPSIDWAAPFRALCADVLGARLGYLYAMGPLAPLAGPPLTYPEGAAPELPAVGALAEQFDDPAAAWVAVNPELYAGARWAVPLWSDRGLIGVFLFGEKRDGGLYTQEELEIAQASGERLVDAQAGAAVANRLMALERRRFAQSQLIDQRTRRVLHDDVLPRLHSLMLSVRGGEPEDPITTLSEIHHDISDLLRELPPARAPEVTSLGLIPALERVVQEELHGIFQDVVWEVSPEADQVIAAIPPMTAEVVFYAAREGMRNAARHGRGGESERALTLKVQLISEGGLKLIISDNGVGISGALEADRGGQGLGLHGTMMAVVGGSLVMENAPQGGTRVVLSLPLNVDRSTFNV
jgi:signal transduction histidine kinase